MNVLGLITRHFKWLQCPHPVPPSLLGLPAALPLFSVSFSFFFKLQVHALRDWIAHLPPAGWPQDVTQTEAPPSSPPSSHVRIFLPPLPFSVTLTSGKLRNLSFSQILHLYNGELLVSTS